MKRFGRGRLGIGERGVHADGDGAVAERLEPAAGQHQVDRVERAGGRDVAGGEQLEEGGGERRVRREHGDRVRHRAGVARRDGNDRGGDGGKSRDPFQLLEDQLDALLTQRISLGLVHREREERIESLSH
jgi:hypothetical protein